ncbi:MULTISPECIES: hypothetical protein [Streptomyces]|uniref:Uncharacterized protein n=1 Tax=Streptomyces galilaeus TaxID=33899 RepID=A0ABW9IYX0_STRGJ
MAGTTRTRKTAAPTTAPAENTTAAETPAESTRAETTGTATAEEPAPAVDNTPKAPDTAPLEPPAVQEPPAPPAAPVYATPTEVIPDDENLADVIIDDVTNEPPVDVDSVFVPLTAYGSTLVCTVRLVEKTFLGPHRNPVHRLLQPAGAHVSESIAARIRERLEAQAARKATPADTNTEQ